jgi:hypothetical protein
MSLIRKRPISLASHQTHYLQNLRLLHIRPIPLVKWFLMWCKSIIGVTISRAAPVTMAVTLYTLCCCYTGGAVGKWAGASILKTEDVAHLGRWVVYGLYSLNAFDALNASFTRALVFCVKIAFIQEREHWCIQPCCPYKAQPFALRISPNWARSSEFHAKLCLECLHSWHCLVSSGIERSRFESIQSANDPASHGLQEDVQHHP